MPSITNKKNFSQKKQLSISSGILNKDDFNGTNEMILFVLPENSLVTNSFVLVDEAGDNSSKLTVKAGGTTLHNAVDIDTKDSVSSASVKVKTKTGVNITVTPSMTLTRGKFVVIVEYIEYTLGNNTYTKY